MVKTIIGDYCILSTWLKANTQTGEAANESLKTVRLPHISVKARFMGVYRAGQIMRQALYFGAVPNRSIKTMAYFYGIILPHKLVGLF